MVKTRKLSRKKVLERARKRVAVERERRLRLIREIAKRRQLLQSAKAEESDDDD